MHRNADEGTLLKNAEGIPPGTDGAKEELFIAEQWECAQWDTYRAHANKQPSYSPKRI